MSLGVYVAIDTITVILSLILMFMALSDGGHRLRVNRLYAILAVSLALWLPSMHVSNNLAIPVKISLVANYVVFASALWASTASVKMVFAILDKKPHRNIKKAYDLIILALIICCFTPLIVAGVEPQEQIYGVVFGPLMPVYGIVLVSNLLVMSGVIIFGIRKGQGSSRQQLKTIGIGMLAAVPLALLFSFILPVMTGKFYFTEFGLTPLLILAVAVYFAVIRHRLFDIKQATMRTVGYVLTIGTMAGIYFLLAYGVSMVFFRGEVTSGLSFSPINIALALVLAFIFQPIKRFFDKLTNRIFYRGEYDRDIFFREFGQILAYDTDLRLLLRQVSNYIGTNLKAETVFFYIAGRGVFGQNGSQGLRIPKSEIEQLGNYYQIHHKSPEAMVAELVKQESIARLLAKYKTEIALPLMLQDQTIGCLFIGEHKSRGYSRRDINTLESIANELTIAIQNSLSVEEVRELNRTLQHRIDEATKELRTTNRQLQRLDEAKDEFMSIASHQLRTPLTTVKGYLDMVLDGDMGKITPMQHKVLSEAFMSSERMVQLINDFLNISRLQTGKFTIDRTWIDLTDIIKEELQLLKVVAKQRDLKLVFKSAKNVPLINADSEKLRQVIINMVDNAIYYSNPGTSVKINLEKEDGNLVFTVVDTGIGVPKSEQTGLFGKFFRGSNARKRRPDGTGVGLFLAKKVVTAHGGEMVFESTEGKGSTFGFKLPIKQPTNKNNEESKE